MKISAPLLLAASLLSVSVYAQSGAIGYASSNRTIINEEQYDHICLDNAFALDLFKIFNRRASSENFLFSSIGVTTALGISLNATSGQTKEQIKNGLGRIRPSNQEGVTGEDVWRTYTDMRVNRYYSFLTWSLERKEGFNLGVYNSIWVDNRIDVSPEFINTIAEPYLGSVHKVDMKDPSTAGQIDSWIGERTQGATSVAASTAGEGGVLLTNVVRIRGTWRNKFEKVDNYRGVFRPWDSKPYEVDYLQSVTEFPYYDDIPNGMHYAEFQFVDESPLRAVSIVIFLPRKSKNLDKMVEKHFNANRWEEMMQRLHPWRLKVRMPAFGIRSDLSLKEVLGELGITRMFTADAQMASLSGSGVFIDDIIQKTSISIDSQGVEAIPINITPRAGLQQFGAQKLIPFFIDGPFVFAIRDRNTGVILSMGKVMNIDN